ncbi:unnamed protein product [Allacma fusca]|uniref:Uncharacterized protein n=1 Tax=Allacma fusca TaxID=39272 RepID=A0A8J2LGW9_9HEXA|nr:unnamed protein product [Allacma fusca]
MKMTTWSYEGRDMIGRRKHNEWPLNEQRKSNDVNGTVYVPPDSCIKCLVRRVVEGIGALFLEDLRHILMTGTHYSHQSHHRSGLVHVMTSTTSTTVRSYQ